MKKSYLKYLFSLLIFGSNGVVASHILLNTYETVFLKALIGSIFLIIVFIFSKSKLQSLKNKRDCIYLIAAGICSGISWMFLYKAYSEIGVSLATLVNYCGPIIVVMLSPIIFKEHLTAYKVIGFVIVIVGMIFVNGNEIDEVGLSFGLICGILAAFSYSFMVIFNKKVENITWLENTVIQLTSSLLIVTIFLFIKQGLYIPDLAENILPVLLLGVVNTGFACYLYLSAIQQLPAGSVAILGYLEPLSALVFSALFLGERLSFIQIIGAVFIIGGAIFAEFYNTIKEKIAEPENQIEPSKSAIDK